MSDANLRDRLLAYRVTRGWSQVRTAEEAGVGHATITNIETGANTKPHRATLMKLALAFGVSLDEFLSDRPPKAPGPSLPLPSQVLRRETGHDYLLRPLVATIIEAAEGMTTADIKQRIRDLADESRVLRTAAREPTEHLPHLFEFPPEALPHAKDRDALRQAQVELRTAAKGLGVRVRALAEVAGDKEVVEEAERIVAEHEEVNELS